MLTAKQIADIIRSELAGTHLIADKIESAAEKIADAIPDVNAMLLSATALENEVTSTLMDMLAATILATLIREETGGRSNISYSPQSMAFVMQHMDYTVENDGLIRTVRIGFKPDMRDAFFDSPWAIPAPGSLMTDNEEDPSGALDQAAEKHYDRPVWAILWHGWDGEPHLAKMLDRKDAERNLKNYMAKGATGPVIQNRHCMHVECPTTGCNRSEVTSENSSGD